MADDGGDAHLLAHSAKIEVSMTYSLGQLRDIATAATPDTDQDIFRAQVDLLRIGAARIAKKGLSTDTETYRRLGILVPRHRYHDEFEETLVGLRDYWRRHKRATALGKAAPYIEVRSKAAEYLQRLAEVCERGDGGYGQAGERSEDKSDEIEEEEASANLLPSAAMVWVFRLVNGNLEIPPTLFKALSIGGRIQDAFFPDEAKTWRQNAADGTVYDSDNTSVRSGSNTNGVASWAGNVDFALGSDSDSGGMDMAINNMFGLGSDNSVINNNNNNNTLVSRMMQAFGAAAMNSPSPGLPPPVVICPIPMSAAGEIPSQDILRQLFTGMVAGQGGSATNGGGSSSSSGPRALLARGRGSRSSRALPAPGKETRSGRSSGQGSTSSAKSSKSSRSSRSGSSSTAASNTAGSSSSSSSSSLASPITTSPLFSYPRHHPCGKRTALPTGRRSSRLRSFGRGRGNNGNDSNTGVIEIGSDGESATTATTRNTSTSTSGRTTFNSRRHSIIDNSVIDN